MNSIRHVAQQNLAANGSQENNGAFYLCRHLAPLAMTSPVIPTARRTGSGSSGKPATSPVGNGREF
jgi:hypothetical protein